MNPAESDELERFRTEWRAEVEHRRQGTMNAAQSEQPAEDGPVFKRPASRMTAGIRPSVPPAGGTISTTADSKGLEFDSRSLKLPIGEPSIAIEQSDLLQIIDSFPSGLRFEPEDERRFVIFNDLPIEMVYAIIRKMDVATVERFARVCRKARILTMDPVYWSELVHATYKPPQLPEDFLFIVHEHNLNLRTVFIQHPRVRMDGIYIATCQYTRPGLSENSWVNINYLITYHRYLRFYPNGQVLSLLTNEEMKPQHVIPVLKPTLRMKGFFIGNWNLTGNTLNIVNLMDASGKYLVPAHNLTTMASDLSTVGIIRPSHIGESMINEFGFSPAPSASTSTSILAIAHSHSSYGRGLGHHGHGNGNRQGHVGSSNSAPAPAQIRYVFDMSLDVRSKPLGRWNRLELVTYDSINLQTGEVHPVPLKHERPFWFSKVRSYG